MTRPANTLLSRIELALEDFVYGVDKRRMRFLEGLHIVVGTSGVASLIAEYGFELSANWTTLSHAVTITVVWWFLLHNLLRLAVARRPVAVVRAHWFDYGLIVALVVGYGATALFIGLEAARDTLFYLLGRLRSPLTDMDRVFLAVTKAYVFVAVVASGAQYGQRLLQSRLRPINAVVISFVLVILVGALLLRLPKATVGPASLAWSDAVFTSVSAVCVTGLTTVDTATAFTWLGQSIVVILIQVGGLGYMTLASFFVLFVGRMGSLRGHAYVRDVFDDASLASARAHLVRIVLFTMAIELIGAAILYVALPAGAPIMADRPRWFYAVFHSVSAFCNAGFALWTRNLAEPELSTSVAINLTIAGLLVLGGLGFSVIDELVSLPRRLLRARTSQRLSIHARIVLPTSGVLIGVGAAAFLWLEHRAALAGLAPSQRLLAAFFHSASARTAGFNTIDLALISVPTALMLVFLMYVGASPGGTGGGVKTTTLGLALASAVATIRGRRDIEMSRRRVPDETVTRAMSIIVFAAGLIFSSTFLLTLTDPDLPLIRLLFEETSAFGTVGLSMGITSGLSLAGKVVLMVSMFLGRVGPLTIAIALSQRRAAGRYDYPTEQVMVM